MSSSTTKNKKQQPLSPKSYSRLYQDDDDETGSSRPPTAQQRTTSRNANPNNSTNNNKSSKTAAAIHPEESEGFIVPSQQQTPKNASSPGNRNQQHNQQSSSSSSILKHPVPVRASQSLDRDTNQDQRPARRPPPVPGTVNNNETSTTRSSPSPPVNHHHRDDRQPSNALEKLTSNDDDEQQQVPSPESHHPQNINKNHAKNQTHHHHNNKPHRATSRRGSSVGSSTLGNTALSRLIADYSTSRNHHQQQEDIIRLPSSHRSVTGSRSSANNRSRLLAIAPAPPVPSRQMSPIEQLIELLQETRNLITNNNNNKKKSLPPQPQPHIVEGKLLSIVVLADLVEKDVMSHHDLRLEEKLAWLLNECGVVLGQCGPLCTNSQIRWKSQEVEFYQNAQEHYERLYGSEKRDAVNWAVCIMNLGSSIIELREEDQNERKLELERRIFREQQQQLQQHRSISTRSVQQNSNVNNEAATTSSGTVTRSISVQESEQDVKVLQQGINIMQYSLSMHRRLYRQYLYEKQQHDRVVAFNNNHHHSHHQEIPPPILSLNNEKELAACLRELGQTLSRLGLFNEAVRLLEEHLQMVIYFAARSHDNDDDNDHNNNNNNKNRYTPEDEDVAAAQNQIGYCLCEAREFRRGIEYQLQAIKNYEDIAQGDDNNDLCTLKMNCGYYLCEDGRTDEGIRMMRSGIDMKRRLLRDDAEYEKYLIRKQRMKEQQQQQQHHQTDSPPSASSTSFNGTPKSTATPLSSSTSSSTFASSCASHSSLRQDFLALARRQIEKLRPSETFAVMLWNCGLQYEKLQDPNYLNDALEMHSQALAMFRRVYPRPSEEHEWIIRSTDKVGKLMQAKAALIKERMYESQHHLGHNNNSNSPYRRNNNNNNNNTGLFYDQGGLHPSPHHQTNQRQLPFYNINSSSNNQKLEFREY